MQSQLKAGMKQSFGKCADPEISFRCNDDKNFLVRCLNSMTTTKSLFALLSNLITSSDALNACEYVADTAVCLVGEGEILRPPYVMEVVLHSKHAGAAQISFLTRHFPTSDDDHENNDNFIVTNRTIDVETKRLSVLITFCGISRSCERFADFDVCLAGGG